MATWQQSYEELKKFIADNPAIEIDPSCVVISGDIRPEFYRLFDNVRAGFVRERCAPELEKAYRLSAAYAETSEAAKEELHLEEIEVNGHLNWFLLDPLNGLIRVLFDPLFDLLKGKKDMNGFIAASDKAISDSFKLLFREGYERWGTLALLRLLAPDRLWMGQTRDFYTDPTMEGDVIEGNHDDFAEDPTESNKVVFDNLLRASFVPPNPIVHSAKMSTFIGLRPRWYAARWKAKQRTERLEWIELKKLYNEFGRHDMWPDMSIHLADQRPEDLRMLADYYYIARPEILVEFMEEDDWYDPEHIASIMRHNFIFTPRFGSYIISRVDIPAEAFQPLEAVPLIVPAAVQEEDASNATLPEIGGDESPVAHEVAGAGAESAETPSAEMAAASAPPMARPLSLAELPADIHVLSVGYDASKLQPVLDAIAEAAVIVKEETLKAIEEENRPRR